MREFGDAANLGWKVAAVLAGGVPASSLDSYQHERRPHVTSLIRLATTVGTAMTGGGRGGDVVRGAVVPQLTRLRPLVARLADSTTPPLRGSFYVRGGGATRRLLAGNSLAGTLAPNAVLGQSGCRLDDRAPGFAVVGIDESSNEQRFEITRRGAVVITVRADSDLGQWLLAHRARSAILRPDGTVMAAGRSTASIYTLLPNSSATFRAASRPARFAPIVDADGP